MARECTAQQPLATVVRHAAETMADQAIRHARQQPSLRHTGDRAAWELVATYDLLTSIDIASEHEPLAPAGLRAVVERAEREWVDRYPVAEPVAREVAGHGQ